MKKETTHAQQEKCMSIGPIGPTGGPVQDKSLERKRKPKEQEIFERTSESSPTAGTLLQGKVQKRRKLSDSRAKVAQQILSPEKMDLDTKHPTTRKRKTKTSLVEIEQEAERLPSPKKTRTQAWNTISSFLEVLQEALHAEDPLESILISYNDVRSVCAVDARFRPLLKDIDLLLKRFEGKPEETKNIFLPFLKKVFSQKMTSLEGHTIAGQLLFLIDHHALPQNFSQIVDNVKEVLQKEKESYDQTLSQLAGSKIYDDTLARKTLLPKTIASLLILEDGSFNSGIFPFLKDSFFPEKESRDAVVQQIISILQQIQSDEQLEHRLEHIEAPQKDSVGERIVNAVLCRPIDTACSAKDARCVVLSSCLTQWRQGDIGNCFIVAKHLEARDTRLPWYMQDLIDLLSHGYIERDQEGAPGKKIRMFGLEFTLAKSSKKLALSNQLFSIPSIRHAFHLVGCKSEEEFEKKRKKFLQATPSLDELLVQFSSLNKTSPALLQQARFMLESPAQALLAQLWENALAGDPYTQRNLAHEYLIAQGLKYIAEIKGGLKDIPPDFIQKNEPLIADIVHSLEQEISQIRFGSIPWELHEYFFHFIPSPFPTTTIIPYIEKDGKAIPFYSDKQFFELLAGSEKRIIQRLFEIYSGETSKSRDLPLLSPESTNESRKQFIRFMGLSQTEKDDQFLSSFLLETSTSMTSFPSADSSKQVLQLGYRAAIIKMPEADPIYLQKSDEAFFIDFIEKVKKDFDFSCLQKEIFAISKKSQKYDLSILNPSLLEIKNSKDLIPRQTALDNSFHLLRWSQEEVFERIRSQFPSESEKIIETLKINLKRSPSEKFSILEVYFAMRERKAESSEDDYQDLYFLTNNLPDMNDQYLHILKERGKDPAHYIALTWNPINKKWIFVDVNQHATCLNQDSLKYIQNIITTPAEWFSAFMNTSQKLHTIYGSDPSFTTVAYGPGHMFRFLPFHQSISQIKNDQDLQKRKEIMQASFKKPRWTKQQLSENQGLFNFLDEISLFFRSLTELLGRSLFDSLRIPLMAFLPDETTISRVLNQLDDSKKYSLYDLVQNLSIILKQKYSFISNNELDSLIFKFVTNLTKKDPEFKELFLHFADMNWSNNEVGMHAALWLNPRNEEWEFAYCTENEEGIFLPSKRESINYFINGKYQISLNPELVQYIEKKAILQFNREMLKKLQRVEQAFIMEWNELAALLIEAPEEELKECLSILSNLDSSLPTILHESILQKSHAIFEQAKASNKNWKQTLQSCFELKVLYKSIFDNEIIQKSEASQFRLTRAFDPSGVLRYLDNHEEFTKALQKLIQAQMSTPMEED